LAAAAIAALGLCASHTVQAHPTGNSGGDPFAVLGGYSVIHEQIARFDGPIGQTVTLTFENLPEIPESIAVLELTASGDIDKSNEHFFLQAEGHTLGTVFEKKCYGGTCTDTASISLPKLSDFLSDGVLVLTFTPSHKVSWGADSDYLQARIAYAWINGGEGGGDEGGPIGDVGAPVGDVAAPVPASAGLMLVGLAGLAALRRRQAGRSGFRRMMNTRKA
jgi:hypothetical protein